MTGLDRDHEQPVTPEYIGSQTVGPYYAIGLDYLVSETLAGPSMAGRHTTISGTVFDADGEPVPDAILELWQASWEGAYITQLNQGSKPASPSFSGFTRLSTHDSGRFRVHTIEPGPVPYTDGRMQAPHIVVLIFMRGLMRHLITRIYFPHHPLNADDPVLQLIPESRRHTLIARAPGDSGDSLSWDIHLQGERETVFFAC